MANVTVRPNGVPDPASFPEPHQFATYIRQRSERYKTHTTLGHCKNAIGGLARQAHNGRILVCDVFIYEYDSDAGWQELFHIPSGTDLDAHPLWQKPAKKTPIKGPSEAVIEKTLASIMESVSRS